MLSVFSLCVFLICLRTVVVLLGSAFPTPITTAIHAGSCPAAGAIYCGGSLLPIGFYPGRCLPVCFFGIQFLVMLFVYRQTVEYVMNRFELLSGIIQFLPIGTFYPTMAAIALALGGGLGFFVSFFTIRRELRV